MPKQANPIRVAIAGGGIAGMTAALRLAQRGYSVTLYEEKPWLGGNMGSHRDEGSGVYHDVYPHMFSNFYVNFWDIVENEIGLKRDDSATTDFESRDSFRTLTRSQGYRELKNAATMDPQALLADMQAGVAGLSPLDMYLYMYSLLDLIVYRFDERGRLGLSLNGFVRSRPFVTEPVAALHDAIVMFIWSIHSAGTSASSYKSFYRHAFGNVRPLLWLLKGSLAEKVVEPLEARLVELGCTIHKQVSVRRVVRDGSRVVGLELKRADFDMKTHAVKVTGATVEAAPFDELVLAVSPGALGRLANEGVVDQRLSTLMPKLTHAGRRLHAEPIAVMDLYFKRKLPGIPRENVSVIDSDCYFSFLDLSQLWPGPEKEGVTALTLAASDYWALPTDNERENAHHMVRELKHYLGDFNAGTRWGDPDADIDWKRSHYHSNEDDVIFVNQVGSWDYRPETHDPQVENLFFAGDYCRNHIDMATVEAAVTSGINAAAALQAKHPLGERIAVLEPPVLPHASLAALKLMLAPSAYASKAWLTATDVANKVNAGRPPAELTQDLTTLMGLPAAFAIDAIETVGSMWNGVLSSWSPLAASRPRP